MKRTGEELLEWFGLKVGDKVRVSMELGTTDFIVIKYENGWYKLRSKVNGIEFRDNITFLLDRDFEIIKQIPKLSEDEKVILRNLPKEYKQIARDKDGDLLVGNILIRSDSGGYNYLMPFNHLFQFIPCDEEPYNIKELLEQ